MTRRQHFVAIKLLTKHYNISCYSTKMEGVINVIKVQTKYLQGYYETCKTKPDDLSF